uniref:cGMP-dependent protein kinase n=1 Tax=Alexandrium monilatum TaxID=311494 RepID=A0A7S4R4M7_9DINO|mmetsp:Transcript_100487/g.319208  ORF Transcript_100487/g.319208 Transcript_100487/m.319208 type:complete len:926 (+) Transcript_100487:175-2952(+)
MGLSESCCCQKVMAAVTAENARHSQEETFSSDGEGVPTTGPRPRENRVVQRKGAKKRIGNRTSNTAEDAGEAHLMAHKHDRKKGKDTRQLIKIGMKQDRLCGLLEDTELDAILDTMEYFEFRKDETIVEQGKMGTTFFVTQQGTLEVSVNGSVYNTLAAGKAFGGLALLYNCPRTATVRALDTCGVWGANGGTFHKVLQDNAQKHYAENRSFLDSVGLFDGLTSRQKDRVGEAFFAEVFEAGARVVTEGDAVSAIYFVKKGELKSVKGGIVKPNGEFDGGTEQSRMGPGDCFGETALIKNEKTPVTVLALGRSELLCIKVGELREVLGSDLAACLERNFILNGLKKSPVISQFSSTQQYEIAKAMVVRDYKAGQRLEEGVRFVIVVEGKLVTPGKETQAVERGNWHEDGAFVESTQTTKVEHTGTSSSAKMRPATGKADSEKVEMRDLAAGPKGARVGVLTQEGLATALKELGLSAVVSAEEASDYTRKIVLVKKVHIFRHLSQEQTNKLVKSFVLQRYRKGAHVINRGEVGSSFFVIANGEVSVVIDGKLVRTLGKNAYFGERALLFDEPRTATVEVVSSEAELWSIEKSTFSQIVKGNMQQELMHRIRLQDTSVTLKDLKHIKVIGAGAAGVVRLVRHKKTQMRYALKRVMKQNGKIPDEVKRECDLLKEADHPFIMTLVNTFETAKSVYILTELITGGELHGAIRTIPTVLSRAHAQFYTGSLIIILEELADKNIVYRDLKPENVMLDQQGYLKLIDFGIAKKLEEGRLRTFTMIGTPHYMAPEVMRGHGYGTEVDLWSLGVMLFEFVCGFLPFADELDDPTEVCTAVLKDPLSFPARYRDQNGRALMQGLMCRQPKKRLGSGIHGYEDVRNAEFFKAGHSGSSLFNKIMGRELDPPVVPKGETYGNPEDLQIPLSDNDELG